MVLLRTANDSVSLGFVQAAGLRHILLGGLVRPESKIHAADEFTTVGDVNALARAILVYLAGTMPESVSSPRPICEGERS